jgi:hypothetical protein
MSETSVKAALEAVERGYQPVPVRTRTKRPYRGSWTHERHDIEMVAEAFESYAADGAENLGLLLGEPSGGLVDVDLDHPKASRLKGYFLPDTAMRSGRAGRPNSHWWYRALGELPGTRRYQMPDDSVSVELRSTGGQTVVPPSEHPTGEAYRWEGAPWGGEVGPAEVPGAVLAIQVALLAMGCVLLENWPKKGGRHEAYLALAGGLLRFGDDVHPWWARNISPLIRALAMATGDEDGPDAREAEAVRTTIQRLREGRQAVGFGKLADIIGEAHVAKVRRLASEIESLGWAPSVAPGARERPLDVERGAEVAGFGAEGVSGPRDPLAEREVGWEPIDLGPYISGEIEMPRPGILHREDGVGLFYPGRINCLYGQSESAKSWVALMACASEMAQGERVMYVDLEDEPSATVERLRLLGIGADDIRYQFTYVRPDQPIRPMQQDRWGNAKGTPAGMRNDEVFLAALDSINPTLVIVDGMTVLYGLHGLDTNDATGTDIITNWLKSLTRGGRSTVIVIDHTGKGAPRGATPLGSQHKVSMVQGTALQVHPLDRPAPGRVGHLELIVGKDRPGQVRRYSSDEGGKLQVAAEVILDSTIEGQVQYTIRAPSSDEVVIGDQDEGKLEQARAWTLGETLTHHIPMVFDGELDVELTGAQIITRLERRFQVKAGYNSWWKAMDGLRKEGLIVKIGQRADARYRLNAP